LVVIFFLWLVFVLAGYALQKIAIGQITELTNTKIETKSVDFNFDGSVFIERLVVKPYQQSKYDNTILKAKTVYARFGIGSLLLLRPRLKQIDVDDFVFDAQYDLDTGRWNLGALKIKAPKSGSGQMPLVRLRGGRLQYSKISNGKVKVVAEVPIDARFGVGQEERDRYSFDMTTAKWARFGKSNLTGYWRPGQVIISGGVSSADVPAFERVWTINVLAAEMNYDRNNNYSLKLRMRDLRSKHRIEADTHARDSGVFLEKFRAFSALQRFFNRYQPAGIVDIEVDASGNLYRLGQSALAGKIYCRDVSICDAKFPYAIKKITGQIDFTGRGASLNNLCGRHGDVEVFIDGWSRDFGPSRQYQFSIKSDNMVLDNDLYDALSTRRKKIWSVFSPSGLAAIDYRINRQSQTNKKSTLAVELQGAEALYGHFPYPLKNVVGKLLFERHGVTISDVVSKYDGRQITLNGQVTDSGEDKASYKISIEAKNIPLDSTLVQALPDRGRDYYSRFDTGGSQSIENLTGLFWSGRENKKLCYRLLLNNEQLELNDDLFSLLPESMEKVIAELQPKGKVNLIVNLNKNETDKQADYSVDIDCLGDSVNFEGFAYPLKDITGRVTMTEDSVKLQNITARAADNIHMTPNNPPIKIDGQIGLSDNALDRVEFALCASDILLDERLGIGLPENIRPFYMRLSPTGRFDLDLENVKIIRTDKGEKHIDFAGTARFKDCSFNLPAGITELNGQLKMKGSYETGSGLCDAEAILSADSLRIKGKSLTNLKADIYYDHEQQCLLTRNLTADCYDGKLTGKLELTAVVPGSALVYRLQAGFDNIDMKQFLSDTKSGRTDRDNYTSGNMSGSLSLGGTVGDVSSRIGRCRLAISDMQVGRLSPLAKLLQVLKLTEPKDFAFDQMLVDSYIKRDRLFFENFDLSGEALAFKGSGGMSLQNQNIDLTLTARGKRLATDEPSMWQSLTEDLGLAVVRMDVSGNYYDPQVITTTLPVIEGTLGILGTKPAVTD